MTDFKLYGVGDVPDEEPLPVVCGLDNVESLKIGASIHKSIRRHIRPHLKPGLKLSELADLIENKCMELTKNQGLNRGIGFPSSLSVDDCAAHFTPAKNMDVTLRNKSITKIDIGVEVNGWITDSAFTIAFDEKYKNLLDGVKDATYTAIKNAAYDADITDWAKDTQEVMESYEVEIKGNIYPIQVIKNLGGHDILKNKIHGDTFLPSYPIRFLTSKRFKNKVYAIESFGSTKSDWVDENVNENTIYMNKSSTCSRVEKRNKKLVPFYNNLLDKFNTLPYCDRYLDIYYEASNYKPKMESLEKIKAVNSYPPLYCSNGGMTAQYEHTIYLDEGKKIIFSNSTDY